MTKTQYKQLRKLINKLEEQALDEGVDITSSGFQLLIKDLLGDKGFTLLEFEEAGKEPAKESIELKGVDQIRGLKGDSPTKEELLTLIKPLIPAKAADGKDAVPPTKKELLTLIKPLIPIVKDGEPGKPGKDANAIGLVENLKWQIEYDIEGVKKLILKPKDWKKELKKLEKDLKKYVDLAAISKGAVGNRPGAPNWGTADKGSYGTAISDSRYYQKSEIDAMGVGGVTRALDNLASVAINTSLVSDTQDTDSLGSATKEWLNLYIGNAGKIYLGLNQDASIHRNAANQMTLTATSGVHMSDALYLGGDLGMAAHDISNVGAISGRPAATSLILSGRTANAQGDVIVTTVNAAGGAQVTRLTFGSDADISTVLFSDVTVEVADHGTPATDEVINVCYGEGEPPAADTTTIGTLFIKHTA